jgi:hypothetical protein
LLACEAIKPLAPITNAPVKRILLTNVFMTFLPFQSSNLNGHSGTATVVAIPENTYGEEKRLDKERMSLQE